MTATLPLQLQPDISIRSIEELGLWDELKSALDVQQYKPKQAAGVIFKELTDKSGHHFILKNGRTHSYIRLSPEEFWIWEKLNGENTIQQLVLAYYLQYRAFAFAAILSLVERLREDNMLGDPPHHLYTSIAFVIKEQSLSSKFAWLARSAFTKEFAIKDLDAHLENIYRRGGWLLFTLPMQILFFLTSVIGMGLFVVLVYDPRHNLLNLKTVVQLGVLAYVPVLIHEFGHAITAKHMGCEVYKGGAMFYYGMPAVFMDTTDVWMFGKRARLAVTWAGPYTGYIIGGACSIVVYLFPGLPQTTSILLLQLALSSIFISTYNILPLLKLDGYYLIADALEIPRLRERSMEFIAHQLRNKLGRREPWTREEYIFLIFGMIAFMSTFYFTYAGIVFWDRQATKSISEFFNLKGDFGASFVNIGMLLFAVSVIFYSLMLIAGNAKRAVEWIRARGLFSTRLRAAFIILVGALLWSWVPRLLLPTLAPWFISFSGVSAFIFSAWLAISIFTDMHGSVHARMWPAIALGMLMGAVSFIDKINTHWFEAFRLNEVGTVLIVIGFFLMRRLLIGLRGSWREISLAMMALGGTVWIISLFFSPIELRTLAGLLTLGGLLHWRMRPATQAGIGDQKAGGSTREKMAFAYMKMKSSIISELKLDFGEQTCYWVEGGLYHPKKKGNAGSANFSKSLAGMTPDDYGGAMALLLDDLLASAERAAGKKFVRRALAYGYDQLDWELQEIIDDYILKYVSHAAGLSNALAIIRNDLDALLRSVPLFDSLTEDELSALKKRFRTCHFKRGEDILREGGNSNTFYIIRTGRADVVSVTGGHLNNLRRGDYFGEISLLNGTKHIATVRALTPLEALALNKYDFDNLVRNKVKFDERARKEFNRLSILRQIPLFEQFEGLELKRIAEILEKTEVISGQVIFRQGESGDRFYIIESGKVSVQIDGQECAILGTGEYFGEIALLMDMPRTASIIAIHPTILLQLKTGDFIDMMQNSSAMKKALERVSSRRTLSNERWARAKALKTV
jgi:CRP-like cAMP-binding protein